MNGDVQLVANLATCHFDTKALIRSPSPAFLARIGGSDTDIVLRYHDLAQEIGPEAALADAARQFDVVRRYNGFYDKEQKLEKIAKFCQYLIDAYQACGQMLVVGPLLLTELFPESINTAFHIDTLDKRLMIHDFIDAIGACQKPARFYPYSYVERILHGNHSLFHTFAQALPGLRVLVVTPFEESIQANFSRRHEFFPNYVYPEFVLETYNTPITYEGLPPEFYPDLDWFETVERMKREISGLEFDIALLACGSYAMPLGLHIRDTMKKKAIYVGGCLQLYFGISGRRYDNPWFLDQINAEAFISPLEREKYLKHIEVTPGLATEAFGAYF